VYTAALLTFSGRVPQGSKVRHDYEAYLSLLDVVQRYLPQLFSETPEALPMANLHVFDTMLGFKAQLDEATRMLDGQQGLIDLTFGSFTPPLCADGDAFDPLAAIVKLMASVFSSVGSRLAGLKFFGSTTVPGMWRKILNSAGDSRMSYP
jgi:hypothetical protein